jgi:hypothetical protein
MIDKIDEENSDNEGDGGNTSGVLGNNNYKKKRSTYQNQL